MEKIGNDIFKLCEELFPINRSLTGSGVRESLAIIKRELPNLKINEIPSGTKCFDWKIPKEWNINDGYVIDPNGNKIIDFKENNLHVMSYSTSVKKTVNLENLESHLYSLPDNPNAIPYITSYYNNSWGFCLSQNDRLKLKKGDYEVFIDSALFDGSLTYAELLIEGKSKKEIFFSTYICHPSLANDNLSGPSLATFLAKYIEQNKKNRFTYRFLFIPETIGSIMYLSKHLQYMKENIIAGFNLTCVGDNNNYSFLPSREGNTLADKVALNILNHSTKKYKTYSFLDRGSDERQYCSPGVDLPVCSIMRSKYGDYDEYHTSLDNLNFISPDGFYGSYNLYTKIIDALEDNYKYNSTHLCEPQLGKRNLYPNISTHNTRESVRDLTNLLAYCDGELDVIDIANKINVPVWSLVNMAKVLMKNKLIKISN